MRLFGRMFRLVWGDEVEVPLRPVLAVGLAGATAGSAVWTFIGIWAIEELGASSSQLAFAFLFGAVAAAGSGYLGGHLSDHVGRRPLILLGWGAQAVFVLAYVFVGDRVLVGLVLVALGGVFGSIGGAADQAMVADIVPRERHEAAYASVRSRRTSASRSDRRSAVCCCSGRTGRCSSSESACSHSRRSGSRIASYRRVGPTRPRSLRSEARSV